MFEGLPLDIIAFCIGKYLQPLDIVHLGATQKRTRRALGKALEQVKKDWKSCALEDRLYKAAHGGDQQLVKLFIQKGASYWNGALYGASYAGHSHLVEFLIENLRVSGTGGAWDWNGALYWASCGGHRHLVDIFIDAGGATNWNGALEGARYNGHLELVKFFEEKMKNT